MTKLADYPTEQTDILSLLHSLKKLAATPLDRATAPPPAIYTSPEIAELETLDGKHWRLISTQGDADFNFSPQ